MTNKQFNAFISSEIKKAKGKLDKLYKLKKEYGAAFGNEKASQSSEPKQRAKEKLHKFVYDKKTYKKIEEFIMDFFGNGSEGKVYSIVQVARKVRKVGYRKMDNTRCGTILQKLARRHLLDVVKRGTYTKQNKNN